MSYIYEALRRAEDENAKGAVASRPIRGPAFAGTSRWWLWVLIGILGANAALLVTLVLVWGSHSRVVTTATPASTAGGAGPVTSAPQGAKSAHVTPSSPPATPAAVTTAPPSSAPGARTVAPAPRLPLPPPRVAERPVTPPTPSASRVDPPRVSTPAVVARDTADPRPASAPPPEATATASPGPVVAPPAKASTPHDTPSAAVDTPKLQVQVVVYSDVAAERMVFIDGRRYAEGDKVDAETVVERITPDGAVVSRRGQRLVLTSGRP